MAPTPGSNPAEKTITPSGRRLKRWLWRIVILALLGVVSWVGWRQVRVYQKQKLIARARVQMEQKDYGQAMISAQRAFELNPRDAAVVHIIVELVASLKSKRELVWHRMLAELEPNVAANNIAWADCALRFGEQTIAEQALGRVDEAGRKTAAFHAAAGLFAQMAADLPGAEEHLGEALRLEPGNVRYQIRLAILHLYSDKEEQKEEARQTLEKYAMEPDVKGDVAPMLLTAYFSQKDWRKALDLAKQLQEAPSATFGDCMVYLGLLRRFQSPKFHSYLLSLQEAAGKSPEHTATLLTWMSENTLVMVAVSWAKTLPDEVATKMPVPPALGECYALLNDWEALKDVVIDKDWGFAEFLRFALLARLQRENGDLVNSRNAWLNAVKATENRTDELMMLVRHAARWGWESEMQDVLWAAARRTSGQRAAINALHKSYVASGNTRGLLNVATRMLEIDPKDPIGINNVVNMSLLLNTNVERAMALADELYGRQPKSPGITSTYAFSLHLRGKTEEAVRLMRSLDETFLNDPTVAAYFAAMLVESDKPEDAAKYIEISQAAGVSPKGRLLPEEMELVKHAHEMLLRLRARGEAAK